MLTTNALPPADAAIDVAARGAGVAAATSTPVAAAQPPAMHAGLPAAVLRRVLDAALAAHRADALPTLCRDHPRLARGVLRRLAPSLAWFGEAVDAPAHDLAPALRTLLGWGLERLRPDGRDDAAPIPRHAWLGASAWRPYVALAAQFGFVVVPDLPGHWRARAGDSAFERLRGLWNVAPSSLYRSVERGRELLFDALVAAPHEPTRRISLADAARHAALAAAGVDDAHDAGRRAARALHAERALQALDRDAADAALWHAVRAEDVALSLRVVECAGTRLAPGRLVDALLEALGAARDDAPSRIRLALARAALARLRGDAADEADRIDEAMRLADRLGDDALLGAVHHARGRFHEQRDPDRAFADLGTAVECHERARARAGAGGALDAATGVDHLGGLVRLGFVHVQRGDARARDVLQRAADVAARVDAPSDTLAMLEHVWAEVHRREGDWRRALEAEHRALQRYERSGHRPQQLRSHATLVLLYGHAGDPDQARAYAERVFAQAARAPIDPEVLAAAHLNLGAACYWAGAHDDAIASYKRALAVAAAASLKTLMARAHHNLAEGFFKRFETSARAHDEHLGDTHVELARALWRAVGDAAMADAAAALKATMLGQHDELVCDRMLPPERVVHFDAFAEIERQRRRLAAPRDADARIDARLRIARAYMAIAVQEREVARALIRAEGRPGRHDAGLAAIESTYAQALSADEAAEARWRATPGCPTPPAAIACVVRQARSDAALSKSVYAELARVSPATASKHLGALTALGLLARRDRGPATRYAAVDG